MNRGQSFAPVVLHVVVPFDRTEGGRLQPLRACELSTAANARHRAEVLGKVYPGALAFSAFLDPTTGESCDLEMIVQVGEVDLPALMAS